jgi:hypothetical protein
MKLFVHSQVPKGPFQTGLFFDFASRIELLFCIQLV